MAVNRDKLFDSITNGAAWDAGVVFNRTNGIPIDKYSVFETYDAALDYALNNPVAYPGQYIAVVLEDGTVQAYIIRANGNLPEGNKGTIIAKVATEDEVHSYAETVANNAATRVKNELLNGAGESYDTLKELGDSIDENNAAIEALKTISIDKADKIHNHNDLYYTETEVDDKISTLNNSITNSVATANAYTDNAVASKTQIQFVIWEDDD